MTRVWGITAGLVGVLLVAGGPATADEQPATADVAKAVAAVDDSPYDPSGRRDPFRPPGATSATHTGEPRTPLQRYDLGQLRLVAVIYDTHEPRAVVEDDQGLGYIVKAGTPIGPNDGIVQTIERGRLVVREDSTDFYGEHHLTEVVMDLRTAERGKQ